MRAVMDQAGEGGAETKRRRTGAGPPTGAPPHALQQRACAGPKDRLPGACGAAQMSPTPIIQALKWLELQGFVRHEANRGYVMAPFSMKEIEEIYELRELLETFAGRALTVERLDKLGGFGQLKCRTRGPQVCAAGVLPERKAFQEQGISRDPCVPIGQGDANTYPPEPVRHTFSQVRR